MMSETTHKKSIKRPSVGVILRHIVLIIWCATTVLPLVWIVMSAFKDNNQILTKPFAVPNPFIRTNFPDVFSRLSVGVGFLNSMLYAAGTVFIVVILSAMVGFYLAKCTRGKVLYTYFIIGMMVPVQALIVPLFISIRQMSLSNTRTGIILVYAVTELAFAILIMTGFIKNGVPDEMIEAAVIDGSSPLGLFFRIVMPLARTGIVTVGTFVFLHVWNEFFCALIFLPSSELATLNLTTFKLRGQYSSDYGLIAAGIVILVLPALAIYALFQEQVVQGLTAGAIKG